MYIICFYVDEVLIVILNHILRFLVQCFLLILDRDTVVLLFEYTKHVLIIDFSRLTVRTSLEQFR